MSQSWKGGPSMERNEVKRKVAFKRSLLTVGRRNSPSFQSPAPHSRWTRAMSRWCEFSQTSFLPSTSPKMDPGGRWTWFPMCKLKISSSINQLAEKKVLGFWGWMMLVMAGWVSMGGVSIIGFLAFLSWLLSIDTLGCAFRGICCTVTLLYTFYIADICRYCSTNCPLPMIESLGHKCWSRAQIGYNRSGFFFLLIFSSRCEWNERKKSKTGANAHKKIHKGTKTKSATQFITRECIFEQPLWYLHCRKHEETKAEGGTSGRNLQSDYILGILKTQGLKSTNK